MRKHAASFWWGLGVMYITWQLSQGPIADCFNFLFVVWIRLYDQLADGYYA